jgi:hypothetical protein
MYRGSGRRSLRVRTRIPYMKKVVLISVLALGVTCAEEPPHVIIVPKPPEAPPVYSTPERRIADAVYQVITANREIYATHVVQRLQNDEKLIKATADWQVDKTLPLPSQMLRMSAELVRKRSTEVSFSLLSLYPINPQSGPRSETERIGLTIVTNKILASYYTNDPNYFVAIFPDKAVSVACIKCHNAHESSPKDDYQLGDVMGGIVIRVRRR